MVSFFDFLVLASRAVKVKFFYCDDDLTEYCAISGTEIFEMKSRHTKYVLMLIGVVHVLVTADKGISQLHEKLQAR
eukprot:CAMPEP_0181244740 /NCGR_PEP_ID=MMETSP1096-20121128/43031_1 /TAXON_ID=156174 ORGANISM="Chrysochromulina ericina, Strain CCMP281" /NCGR_SAMPLE_ID=MMETSP1096 /ASSEMBLY_ACC=CAM_ASM_000453 /LENGTH=75 /DNA_ID=CAMNT_0023341329 /DNA_START=113 /DNA_END=336 /DNA_ORIENTATION=-